MLVMVVWNNEKLMCLFFFCIAQHGGQLVTRTQRGVPIKCCNNAFEAFVKRGTEVKIAEPIEHTVNPSSDGQKSVRVTIYSTDALNPLLAKDGVCKEEGTVLVNMPPFLETTLIAKCCSLLILAALNSWSPLLTKHPTSTAMLLWTF